MKFSIGNGMSSLSIAILGLFGLLSLFTGVCRATDVPDNFDNQGGKIYNAHQLTTEAGLTADSGGRNLADYYGLRQYPGSPPRIPHEVDPAFGGGENDCLSCHGKGGFSAEFGRFAPVTPHPENTLCYQCHAQTTTTKLFVETEWKSVRSPRLGLSSLASSPPPVPHSLQLRENCIACHTGPGAVTEIRVSHASRGDCRQCHATVVQGAPLLEFDRK
ncbi:hypothetical protein [Desulforhopalus singaporensis]|uniref:Periplasmic nitrate reductase subunit NapB n=1 Tax=Desulforhopalus singaporensis TaxID=91360 RepID=A0A1H0T852_9BACT|nr:hypothetical protein [Desulforhopalus singaporensis]SDP49991.1 periplasmic nitrate reductase subunit NapB [Desulforhopalus singaporensis]